MSDTERPDSFPCVICGKRLPQCSGDYVAQPYGGVMCQTNGNYGSTVYDPLMSGRYIAFNICDECFVQKGDEGVLMESQEARPVRAMMPMGPNGEKGLSIVGWQKVRNIPFEPWTRDTDRGMFDENDSYVLDLNGEVPEDVQLNIPIEDLREAT
jgi:hypothetical protein